MKASDLRFFAPFSDVEIMDDIDVTKHQINHK